MVMRVMEFSVSLLTGIIFDAIFDIELGDQWKKCPVCISFSTKNNDRKDGDYSTSHLVDISSCNIEFGTVDSEYQKVGVQTVRLDELTVKLDFVALSYIDLEVILGSVRAMMNAQIVRNNIRITDKVPNAFCFDNGLSSRADEEAEGSHSHERYTGILQLVQCEVRMRLTIWNRSLRPFRRGQRLMRMYEERRDGKGEEVVMTGSSAAIRQVRGRREREG